MNPDSAGTRLITNLLADERFRVRTLRSVKLSERAIRWDRILVTVHRRWVDEARRGFFDLLSKSGSVPEAVLDRAADLLALPGLVSYVHIGRDSAETDETLKLYFEIEPNLDSVPVTTDLPPHLSHLAFKWSTTDESQPAEVRYQRLPSLADRGPMDLFALMLGDAKDNWGRFAGELAHERLGLDRRPADDALLVSEVGTARRSIDLKVPRNRSAICEGDAINRWLEGAGEVPDHIRASLAPTAPGCLRRLAMGRSRTDERFLTLYFSP